MAETKADNPSRQPVARRARTFLLAVVPIALMTALPIALAAATTRAVGGNPPPPDPVGSPGNPAQSLKDGCQRNPLGLLSRNSPEWSYVYNANTSSTGAPPSPQWVTGTVSSFNPKVSAVHTSGGDLPPGHSAYDYNVNILPDHGYRFLLAGDPKKKTGNYAGTGEETNRLHTEWEDLSVPKFAWVEPGDRLTELGSWVWDCGHWGTPTEIFPPGPDYILPDIGIVDLTTRCLTGVDPPQCKDVTGEGTEFHAYRAFWDVRRQGPNSPFGAKEAALFVSTDQTPAGQEADCAHRNPPVPFGPGNPDYLTYPPTYRACLLSEPNWQDVSGHYSFFLAAPPRPNKRARLVFRAVRNPSSSANAPRPKLTKQGNGVQVTFDLATDPATKPVLKMGYTVFAGWGRYSAVGNAHAPARQPGPPRHPSLDGCARLPHDVCVLRLGVDSAQPAEPVRHASVHGTVEPLLGRQRHLGAMGPE